jgi:hypothetical protein
MIKTSVKHRFALIFGEENDKAFPHKTIMAERRKQQQK